MITYEYPLNERVRTLLRLEDLFDRVDFFVAQESPLDHQAGLLSIFEILEVASRGDLKSDLLQELDRQRLFLEALRNNPAISEEARLRCRGNRNHLCGFARVVGEDRPASARE